MKRGTASATAAGGGRAAATLLAMSLMPSSSRIQQEGRDGGEIIPDDGRPIVIDGDSSGRVMVETAMAVEAETEPSSTGTPADSEEGEGGGDDEVAAAGAVAVAVPTPLWRGGRKKAEREEDGGTSSRKRRGLFTYDWENGPRVKWIASKRSRATVVRCLRCLRSCTAVCLCLMRYTLIMTDMYTEWYAVVGVVAVRCAVFKYRSP